MMGDNINQKNVFGGNLAKSNKTTTVNIILNNHRVQGFVAGIIVSIIASYIYDYLKCLFL